MIPTIIRRKLAALRQRERLLRFVWGISRLLTVILGLVLLFCLIDYVVELFDDTPFAVHVLLLAVLFAGSFAAGVYFFWPLSKKLDDDELSLWIEDKTPALEHRLISAVQFNEEGAEFTGMSVELVGVVTREAEDKVRHVEAAKVADHRRLKRSALILGPALAAAVIPMLIWPGLCGILLGRLFLADWEIPRRVAVFNATAPVYPRGESVVIKVKARGALPTDRARLVFTQGRVTDRVNMEIARETLPLKLDLLADRTAGFRSRMAAVRGEYASTRGNIAQTKNSAEVLEELMKNTDDPDRQRLLGADLEKLKTKGEVLLARNMQLSDEIKKHMVAEQDALKDEIEDHGRELVLFLKERPNADAAEAVKQLELAADRLDRGNDTPFLAAAHEHLLAAQTLMSKTPIRLIEGDVLLIKLPMAPDDASWVVSKKDQVLVPEGEPEIRTSEQAYVLRFQAASAGTGSLELSCQKKEGGAVVKPPFKLSAQVEPREVIYYRAEVKAPTSIDVMTFNAYVGDGRIRKDAHGKDSQVKFEPRPVADVAAFTILPPYCQTTPEGLPYELVQARGEVSGIPGSNVRIQASILKEIQSATLKVFETEDLKSDDLWKKRERCVETIPMELFLKNKKVEVKSLPFTRIYDAKGEPIDKGLDNAGFKQDALVNFVTTPTGTLLQLRLLDADSKPLDKVDGPHKGTITSLDAAKGLLTVERSEGPAIAEARFALRPRTSKYSIEVVDNYGFKNDPIPRFAAKEIVEAAPTVKLLREEIPSMKKYDWAGGRDDSGIFDGMPVPIGQPIVIAYQFSSLYGVDKAVLKYRIRKKSLSGNENNNSSSLGLSLDDGDGITKIRQILAGGPAEKAKLKIDDTITQVDGAIVKDVETFMKIVNARTAGDELTLKVKRLAENLTVKIKVGAASDENFRSFKLIRYVNDGRKGDFDVDRGCFDKTGPKESVWFYAVPSPKPYSEIGRLNGGGRFLLETTNLGGGKGPQEDDEIEFFVEVYPAEKSVAARLGVTLDSPDAALLARLDARLVDEFELNKNKGSVITMVRPGSPAALAGLAVNDILVNIDGRSVSSSQIELEDFREFKPRAPFPVLVLRAGAAKTIEGLTIPEPSLTHDRPPPARTETRTKLVSTLKGLMDRMEAANEEVRIIRSITASQEDVWARPELKKDEKKKEP